jgi:hypothetical protein
MVTVVKVAVTALALTAVTAGALIGGLALLVSIHERKIMEGAGDE